jgi:hypothetical protein
MTDNWSNRTTWAQVQATIEGGDINYGELLDKRQRKQIEFAQVYAREFAHGATAHNDMLLIAKLVEILDAINEGCEFTRETR